MEKVEDRKLKLINFRIRLKRWLVLIVFGTPIIFFCLNFFLWPAKFDEISSNPVQIALFWCTVIAVFDLILLETYRGKLLSWKYYDCVCLVAIESTLLLLIFTYGYSIVNTYSIEKCLETIQEKPFYAIVLAFYIITNKLICVPIWMRNTLVHIWLCRYTILAKKPTKRQYYSTWSLNLPLRWQLLGWILCIISVSLYYISWFELGPRSFLLPLSDTVGTILITELFRMSESKCKFDLHFVESCIVGVVGIVWYLLLLLCNGMNFPDLVWMLIFCLLIGHHFLLDTRIDGKKYRLLFEADPIETESSEIFASLAIFDSSAEGTILPLDDVKYVKLRKAINNAIFTDIDKMKCDVLPTFTDNDLICGVMKIDCRTPQAKSWITDMIRRVGPLWQNMQLKVEDFDKLTLPNRVIGFFTLSNFTPQQIQRMLNAMNPELNVNSWTIIRSKMIKSDGQVVFDIPESDLTALRKRDFRLFFGAGCSPFWDITMSHGVQWLHLNEQGNYDL